MSPIFDSKIVQDYSIQSIDLASDFVAEVWDHNKILSNTKIGTVTIPKDKVVEILQKPGQWMYNKVSAIVDLPKELAEKSKKEKKTP